MQIVIPDQSVRDTFRMIPGRGCCIFIQGEFESYHPCKIFLHIEMKLRIYMEEAYNELVHKVSWPTWKELQNSALIVMVASLIIALIVFVMDISFDSIMDFVYSLFY
jgi:preprotein translocase subunit SecE